MISMNLSINSIKSLRILAGRGPRSRRSIMFQHIEGLSFQIRGEFNYRSTRIYDIRRASSRQGHGHTRR